MRVLITGGFGYLGGRLAQSLAARPEYGVALGSRARTDTPSWLPSARAVQTDWTSTESLERACADTDAVVHLAGMNAADCAADPVAAFEVNAVCTARLVAAAITARVRRFIYMSTAHVYGALRGRITEQTAPVGLHPYAATHRAAEDAVRMAHESGHLEGAVIRLSNAYGAPANNDAGCWTLLVNDLCRQAVATGRMVLRSSGAQKRDFIAMSDACDAIAHLLQIPASVLRDGLFNVGGNWSPSVLQMTELLADRFKAITGTRPSISWQEGGPADDAESLWYDTSRLGATGFHPGGTDRKTAELDELVRFCARQAIAAQSR